MRREETSVIVRMWEACARPEAHQELLAWVCDTAVARIEHDMAHISSEVLTSPDRRVVVVSRWRAEPRDLPPPPPRLLDGAVSTSDYSVVDR